MKKLLLTAIFTIFSISVFPQDTQELDIKNGFKDFRFGDDLNENNPTYNGKLKYLGKNEDGSLDYEYISDYPNNLFNYKWSYLNLRFYDGELGKIYIAFNEEMGKKLFEDIQWKLQKVFGWADSDPILDATVSGRLGYSYICYFWKGQQVKMDLIYTYEDGTYIKDEKSISLTITSKKVIRDYLNKQF